MGCTQDLIRPWHEGLANLTVSYSKGFGVHCGASKLLRARRQSETSLALLFTDTNDFNDFEDFDEAFQ